MTITIVQLITKRGLFESLIGYLFTKELSSSLLPIEEGNKEDILVKNFFPMRKHFKVCHGIDK